MYLPDKSKGFTLVELLVVISIIAILSVIGITIFTSTQSVARDAKRRADANAIHKALEQYKLINGSYPAASGRSCGASPCPATAPSDTSAWTTLVGGSTYYTSGAAPVDPFNSLKGSRNYTYTYDGVTEPGKVCVEWLENSSTNPAVCLNPQQ